MKNITEQYVYTLKEGGDFISTNVDHFMGLLANPKVVTVGIRHGKSVYLWDRKLSRRSINLIRKVDLS